MTSFCLWLHLNIKINHKLHKPKQNIISTAPATNKVLFPKTKENPSISSSTTVGDIVGEIVGCAESGVGDIVGDSIGGAESGVGDIVGDSVGGAEKGVGGTVGDALGFAERRDG